MKLDPILTRAVRLLRRGKYGEVVQTLQPEIVRYHDHFRYYYILALACLYLKDFRGAHDYYSRARNIKMREPGVLLGLAALHLRRGDTDRAIDLYLEVQEIEPKNPVAGKALKIIRKYSGSDNLFTWIETGNLPKLYPPKPREPFSPRRLGIPVLVLLAGVLGFLYAAGVFPRGGQGGVREGLSDTVLEQVERDTPVQVEGSYRYILTRNQVLDSYAEARTLFTERRDEAAKVALNRIIESNAAEPIKNKARLLISYTEVPGFDSLKDRFKYAEVIREPALYRGCYVIWRGMASNLREEERGTSFDFLVGYDTRSVLEGIVPVDFNFPVAVNPERPLEVLGYILPVAAAGGEGLRLRGTALHQSGLPEPAATGGR
ncbi:MAG: tetratricopeptide repeat protein [Spirochaetaceae bacterium]|jgi:tetratricopeptide (TPR) repeat protein|nr:tetratricopeptide repeat protein [Spirochaetaceae bacterium]